MLDALWFRLLEAAERMRREDRGDSLVNWVVLAVGLAAAAAAVVALLKPAIQTACSARSGFRAPNAWPTIVAAAFDRPHDGKSAKTTMRMPIV